MNVTTIAGLPTSENFISHIVALAQVMILFSFIVLSGCDGCIHREGNSSHNTENETAEVNSKEATIVAEIKRLGGKVTYDENSPDQPVIGVDLSRSHLTDDWLGHLQQLSSLRSLDLWNTRVSDVGLQHLEGLSNLQTLYLGATDVTDAGLKHLKGLTNLRSLDLGRNPQLTVAGLENLKRLPNLRSLNSLS
jgi:Leucine-rich repeat (LRR) protein